MNEKEKIWAERYGWSIWFWLAIASYCLMPIAAMSGHYYLFVVGFAGVWLCSRQRHKFETVGRRMSDGEIAIIPSDGNGIDGGADFP